MNDNEESWAKFHISLLNYSEFDLKVREVYKIFFPLIQKYKDDEEKMNEIAEDFWMILSKLNDDQ